MSAQVWDNVHALNTELLALMPYIFSPTSVSNVAVSYLNGPGTAASETHTPTPIRCLRKVGKYAHVQYLMIKHVL